MPDRAVINEVVNIGMETTPGTAVAANRRLQGVRFDLSPDANFDTFKPGGGKYTTVSVPTREWSAGSIEGKLSYNEIVYLLSMGLTRATPAQIMDGASPTGAYRWTFNPLSSGSDNPYTATVEVGQSLRAHRVPFALLSGLSLGVTRNETTVGGDILAQRIEDGITLTANPTETAIVPVLPGQCDVYLDTTSGGIGATKLTRLFEWELTFGDRFGGVFPVDSTKPSYADFVETDLTAQLRLVLEADAAGMALLPPMRAGDTRYVRLRAIGPQIWSGATPNYHQLTVDTAVKVADMGDFGDVDGVRTMEWTFDLTHDPAWGTPGKALTIEAINKLTAL